MAELVRRQHVAAEVGYHGFGFQESHDADLPVPFPDDFTFGVFLASHPGRFDVFSAGHTHTASVEVEVWDAPAPPEDPGRWDEQAETDFDSTSGDVAVWSMSAGRQDDLVHLADTGGAWRVRVCSAGRQEATLLSEQEGTAVGVERYLVQFWPRQP